MILDLLRKLLVDYALDHRNEEMFRRLTGEGWEKYVVQPTGTGSDAEDWKHLLVLRDANRGSLAVFHFTSVFGTVVFAVPEDEWDDCGWRDQNGLTFYDRLRSAGYRIRAMWVLADDSELTSIREQYRVVHPGQLVLSYPGRKLTVADTQPPRKSQSG